MCTLTRKSPDPLLRRFLDVYGLHLLRCPRAGINVGSLILVRDGRSAVLERLDDLLDGPVSLVGMHRSIPMAEAEGVISDALDLKSGIGISKAFLQALGLLGISAKLNATLKNHKDIGLHFRFSEPMRDSINPASIGAALIQRKFNFDHPIYDANASYYIVTAVARSQSIDIRLSQLKERGGDIDTNLEQLVDASSSIQVQQLDNTTWRFQGNQFVVFGLELFKLTLDTSRCRMQLELPSQPVAVRRSTPNELELSPSLIGDEMASPFLDIDF